MSDLPGQHDLSGSEDEGDEQAFDDELVKEAVARSIQHEEKELETQTLTQQQQRDLDAKTNDTYDVNQYNHQPTEAESVYSHESLAKVADLGANMAADVMDEVEMEKKKKKKKKTKVFPRILDNKDNWKFNQNIELHHIEGRDMYFCPTDSIRKVYVETKVKRLSDIDMLAEKFRCRFHIYLTWLMTLEEYMTYKTFKEKKRLHRYSPKFNPRIDIVNVVEKHEYNLVAFGMEGAFRKKKMADYDPKAIGFDPLSGSWTRLKIDCDYTFSEQLELRNFPVDVQDFAIVIRETSAKGQVYLMPSPRLKERKFGSPGSSFFRVDQTYSVLDEWQFRKTVVEFAHTSAGNSRSGSSYHQMTIRFKMKRKWSVYFYNIVLYTMIITLMTTLSFTLNNPMLGERMNVIVTLVLTAVAMQYNVQKMLPKLPYVTLIDKYLLFSFFYISVILMESTLSGQWTTGLDNMISVGLETYVGNGFVLLWIVYHFAFVIYAGWKANIESSKLFMSSDEVPEAQGADNNFMSSWWFEDIFWVGAGKRICAFVSINKEMEGVLDEKLADNCCEFVIRQIRKMSCMRCLCSLCPSGDDENTIQRRLIRGRRAVSTVDEDRAQYFKRTNTGGFNLNDTFSQKTSAHEILEAAQQKII